MDKKYRILVICAVILVLGFIGTASAKTWHVDDSGGANFTRIQDAINNECVIDGDTILVYPGIYCENVVVNKSITLKGIDHPTVDACGDGNAITLCADGITLEGFNATNSGSSWEDAGIKVISNNNTITSNSASNNRDGIYLEESSNNNITGNNFSNNYKGIWLYYYCNSNTIAGNNFSNNNEDGIYLDDSRYNTIAGNNFSNNNYCGISLEASSNNNIADNTFVNDGLFVYYSYQNTVEDNIVNGKPLVYLEDASDYKVENAGQVILVNCANITVENLNLSNTSIGIELLETEGSIISSNNVRNHRLYGIHLEESSNNNITSNNVRNNNYDGIYLDGSSNNTITSNNLHNNTECGISSGHSSNNTVTGNNVSNNGDGIGLWHSSNNNAITGNKVSNNNYAGIYLFESSNNNITGNTVSSNRYGITLFRSSNNNKVYLNNFIDSPDNVYSYKSTNIWNSTENITYIHNGSMYTNYMGNCWDDYNGTDANNDGIGDTPCIISGDNPDNYPLTEPFENYFHPPAPLPTLMPSSSPSPPTPPGFEALFTIAGLLTVAYILLRRKR